MQKVRTYVHTSKDRCGYFSTRSDFVTLFTIPATPRAKTDQIGLILSEMTLINGLPFVSHLIFFVVLWNRVSKDRLYSTIHNVRKSRSGLNSTHHFVVGFHISSYV